MALSRESKEEQEEGFQYWLDYMDDALDEFFARLPKAVTDKLDYSVDSLDVLEAWILERYPTAQAARAETDSLIFDGAARYIGETFRKTIGGHWWVDLEHNTMHGLPQITGFRSGPGAVCPLTLATASTDRRRGDFISQVLRIQLAKLSKHNDTH